ncbi:transcriptional repressor [Chitinimonas sp.]|uniref:transcriptional repressor n=1 Tax=Chitinimonas sp. TaxID=1934313 RepID=UPI0035B25490
MTAHAHIDQDLDNAAIWCSARGEKLTDQRREVLSLLLTAPGSMKAYELLAEVQKRKPTAAPPTIYRALDFLVSVGLAHKLESMNAFVACCDFENPHHGVMLICDRCHGVSELHDAGLAARMQQEASKIGFAVAPQDVELHGACAACRAAGEESA